jgi:hypothetical protein
MQSSRDSRRAPNCLLLLASESLQLVVLYAAGASLYDSRRAGSATPREPWSPQRISYLEAVSSYTPKSASWASETPHLQP